MHLQRSPELDEVREAIGLRPAGRFGRFPTPGQPVPGTSVLHSDVMTGRYLAGSLNRGTRRFMGVVSAVSGGAALTHQMLAGALAGAHGAGPWGAAATLLAWPAPLVQPILAGIGALVLCAIGMITRGWRDIGLGQTLLVAAGTMAGVLGAGPMVLVCVLTVIAFALTVIVGLVIVFYILARLLR